MHSSAEQTVVRTGCDRRLGFGRIGSSGGRLRRFHGASIGLRALVFASGSVQITLMTPDARRVATFVCCSDSLVLALSGGVWRYAYCIGCDQLHARGQAGIVTWSVTAGRALPLS